MGNGKVELKVIVFGTAATGVPTCVPPVVHGVFGAPSVHSVKVTVPIGAPPWVLPVTVAESFHDWPTVPVEPPERVVVNEVGATPCTGAPLAPRMGS